MCAVEQAKKVCAMQSQHQPQRTAGAKFPGRLDPLEQVDVSAVQGHLCVAELAACHVQQSADDQVEADQVSFGFCFLFLTLRHKFLCE